MSQQQEMMQRLIDERDAGPKVTQQQMMDAKLQQRADDLGWIGHVGPYAKGMSFGLNDEFAGMANAIGQGAANLVGMGNDKSMMENYRSERDAIRNQNKTYETANPMRAMAGEMVGGAVTGGVAGAPLMAGKTGLQALHTGMLVGGGESSLMHFGEMENTRDPLTEGVDAATSAVIGAGIGGAVPYIANRVQKGARVLLDKYNRPDKSRSQAQDYAKQLMAGDSEKEILERASRLDPDATAVESMNAGETLGQGVLSRDPSLINHAREGISSRVRGSTDRVSGTIENLTGHKPKSLDEMRRLSQKRLDDASPEYAKFAQNVPEYRQDLNDLMQRPDMQTAWKKAQKLARNKGEALPELFQEVDGKMVSTGEYPDFKAWDFMKQALWDIEQKSYRAGSNKAAGATGGIRRELTRILDEIEPDYAKAREAWGSPSQDMEMIELGERFFKDSTKDIVDNLQGMGQRDKSNYLTGMWEAAQEKMGKAQEGFKSNYSFWDTPNNQKKLRALFPDGEDGEAMMQQLNQRISNENVLRNANNKVLENSQTYMRESANNMLEDSSVGLMDWITSPIESIGKMRNRRPDISGLSELGNRAFSSGGTQRTLDFINENGMSRQQIQGMLQRNNALEEALKKYGTGAAPSVYEQYR